MFVMRLQIIILVISSVYSQLNPNTYGPFKVRWRSYELCSGPKRENLTYISKSLLVENEIYKGVINMTFEANTRIDEIKINVVANNNSKTNPIAWNYKVLKPCQHYSIAWVLNQHLNANNCVVKKLQKLYNFRVTASGYEKIDNRFDGNICLLRNELFTIRVESSRFNGISSHVARDYGHESLRVHGFYHSVVDFTDATNKFFANKFFYGDFLFKLVVLSNKGNIACIIFNPIFSKT